MPFRVTEAGAPARQEQSCVAAKLVFREVKRGVARPLELASSWTRHGRSDVRTQPVRALPATAGEKGFIVSMTTRAAVCRAPGQPWEITELELDEPKANEIRIKFHAAGLCHSDDHIQKGDAPMRMPVVGGHEGAGVVDAVGPGVTRVKLGDHLVCSFIPACGSCRYCSTGRQNLCDAGKNAATGEFADGTFRFHQGGEDF